MANDFHPDIHKQIKLNRVEKRLTKRDLAGRIGISPSHMHRLEIGAVAPSSDEIRKLSERLEFEPWQSAGLTHDITKTSERMVHANLYASYGEASEYAQDIVESYGKYENPRDHPAHAHCALSLTFHALIEASRRISGPSFKAWIERLYPDIVILKETYRGFEREIAYIVSALYHFTTNTVEQGVHFLRRHRRFGKDANLLGFNHFLQGLTHYYDFRKQQVAMTAFERANEAFLKTNNFERVTHIKLYMQSIALNIGAETEFRKLNRDLDTYVRMRGNMTIYYRNKIHEVRYRLLRKEYDKAADVLRKLKNETVFEYRLYDILTRYRLGDVDGAKKALRAKKKTGMLPKSHRRFIEAMDALLKDGPVEETLRHLKAFTDGVIAIGHVELIPFAVELYTETLEKHRQYKQAARYSAIYLELLEEAVKEGGLPEDLSQGTVV